MIRLCRDLNLISCGDKISTSGLLKPSSFNIRVAHHVTSLIFSYLIQNYQYKSTSFENNNNKSRRVKTHTHNT